MQKLMTSLPEIKLVGITCRTNNSFELSPLTAKIGPTLLKYFNGGYPEKINQRKNPGITYCVYTNYESDVTGDYTYFVGEEVESFANVTDNFETLTIPAQNYAKFTNGPGNMPEVCISAWQQIWMMPAAEMGGERSYLADFEVYDTRKKDLFNVTLDIYVGIKGLPG